MPDANELLRINLHEVTSERDPEKRRAAIERAYVEDLRFLDSEAELVGRQAFSDRIQKILDDAPADFVLEVDGLAYVGPDTAAQTSRFGPPRTPAPRWRHPTIKGAAPLPRGRATLAPAQHGHRSSSTTRQCHEWRAPTLSLS